MKIKVKPECCEECKEKDELQWDSTSRRWLCKICIELLLEEEYEDDRQSGKYITPKIDSNYRS